VTPPLPSEEAIRAAVHEVLAREPYARFRFLESDWLSTLQRWFEDYLGWMRDLSDRSPVLFGLLLAGLLLLGLLLLGHVVWSLRVAMRGRPRASADAPTAPRRDFAAEAVRLAGLGDTLEACRALQLACLELLVRSGVVSLARHDGNAALRRRLRGSSLPVPLREELIRGIDQLERSWFRDRAPSADLYSVWQHIHAGLRETVA